MPPSPLGLRRRIALAALALVAGACSGDVLDPATPRAADGGPRLAASSAGKPTFIRNAVKYRELGAKPATGRSGTSTLTLRALLGKDGGTELEVTTGVFDPVPLAERPLTRVQVKLLDAAGRPLRTLNYNGLAGGGTATFRYPGLARGGALQVQGNVTEGRRTDVVSVTGTVQRRPDLRVRVEAPQQVRRGFPVNLVAIVSEANGDVGARADCVLSVDGAEADRARGIWVDAGGAVSCAFTHVFASAGASRVRVEAANVSPADWDPSDNADEATVQVTGGSDFSYTALAEDYVESTEQTDNNQMVYDGGQVIEQGSTVNTRNAIQSGALYASMPHGVSLATVRVKVSQSTNGVTVHAGAWPEAAGGYPLLAAQPGCTSTWSGGVVVYLCSIGTPDAGVTNVQYLRTSSEVTYYGTQHIRTWYLDAPDNVYTYSFGWNGSVAEQAPQITMGADYSFAVELTDGARSYRLNATVPLHAPQTRSFTFYPPTGRKCTTTYNPELGFRSNICRTHRTEVTKRNGTAFGSAE
jgi:hypothetical protein